MTALPASEHLRIERHGWRLDLTLHRPAVKNALSFALLDALRAALAAVADDRGVRAIVLRGAGGDLCAGGDVKDMAAARLAPAEDGADPLAQANRRYGRLLEALDQAPQAVITVAEGAVMGGGVGLLCAADLVLALPSARVRLPETTLGLTPAQVAPFVVRRVGLARARRLMVLGGELDAAAAREAGLVDEVCPDEAALQAALGRALEGVGRCAPEALARTKRLVLSVPRVNELEPLLDLAAGDFAEAARGPEAAEGMAAFLEKRAPRWAVPVEQPGGEA